jgi:Spy/CpxP family protein refolding chaperone
MTKTLTVFAAALLALAVAAPAVAAETPAAAPNAEMMAKRMAIRQDMQKLHDEGVEIQKAIDTLLDKCIAPEAAAVEGCKKDRDALVQRRAEHKNKIEALREKMQSEGGKIGPRKDMQKAPAAK